MAMKPMVAVPIWGGAHNGARVLLSPVRAFGRPRQLRYLGQSYIVDRDERNGWKAVDTGAAVSLSKYDRHRPTYSASRSRCAELITSALRAFADQAPRPLRRTPLIDPPDQFRGNRWLTKIEQACGTVDTIPRLGPQLALARAELARWHAEPCIRRWSALLTEWTAFEAPYEQAYVRWRLAEAILTENHGRSLANRMEAQKLLTAARKLSAGLGAQPMTDEIDALGRRAHLTIHTPSTRERPVNNIRQATGRDLGLTRRENEVLRLVAAGDTNGQIANTLYISRKTASVHVSIILRKLNVSSRLEAATIAAKEWKKPHLDACGSHLTMLYKSLGSALTSATADVVVLEEYEPSA